MAEVAKRLSIDPLLLPERTLALGALQLHVTQEWLQHTTTPDNTGSACWPGSMLLAHWVLSPAAQTMLGRCTGGAAPHSGRLGACEVVSPAEEVGVLELGCGGAAVPGTCVLRRWPHVRVTFVDRSSHLLSLAERNVARNLRPLEHVEGQGAGRRWEFAEVEWGAALPTSVRRAGGWGVILCAELLYEAEVVPLLLRTVGELLARPTAVVESTDDDAAATSTARGGGAVFAHRRRNGAHEALLRHAPEHGLSWAPLDWRPWPPAPGTDGCRQTEGEAVSGGVGAEHSVVVVSRSEAEGWGCPLDQLELGVLRRV
jgi:SAM-dependent methyltransferase